MRTTTRRWLLSGLLAAGLAAGTTGWAVADQATTTPYRPVLPAPTGPFPIGATELHLVDPARTDPVTGGPRELMISIWYPAWPAGRQPAVPYLRPLVAPRFAARADAALGLAPGRVDWAGITTHARAGAPALGRHPVVLYSPGGGELRTGGTTFVEELVSHGTVVVTIDHTHEAPEVEFPGGRLVTQQMPGPNSVDLLRLMIRTRVADSRFVLDRLTALAAGRNPDAGGRTLPRGLASALDLQRVGAYGHSAGGFTSFETMLADRRVDAAADLDGSLAYSFSQQQFGDVVSQGLDRPFLLMGAGIADDAPHHHLAAEDWRRLWQNSTGRKLDLYLAAGEHFTFTDHQALLPQLVRHAGVPEAALPGSIGTVAPERAVRSIRSYLVAFFAETLHHRPQPLLTGPSPAHPDVTFIS